MRKSVSRRTFIKHMGVIALDTAGISTLIAAGISGISAQGLAQAGYTVYLPLVTKEGIAMPRLIVVAMSEDGIAAPGNRLPNYFVVSVTDVNGAPVTGLASSNFTLQALLVGAGGAYVSVTDVRGGGIDGFYLIDAVPIQDYTWVSGVYIFAIAVHRTATGGGIDQGQTLASVFMD